MRQTYSIKTKKTNVKIILRGNYKKIFNSKKYCIIGNFGKFIIKDKIFDIDQIENLINEINIETLICNSVGKFLILDKVNERIFLSFSFGSIYFLKNTIFANYEKDLFKFVKKRKIHDLNFSLNSHRNISPYPLNGFIEGIKRLPPGFCYEIKNKNYHFIQSSNKKIYKASFKEYVGILEIIFSIYKKEYKKSFELAFSGGMDSTVLFIMLIKNKIPFQAYHNIGNNHHQDIAYLLCESFCKKYKIKLTLRHKKKLNYNELLKELSFFYFFHFKLNQLNKLSYPNKKNYIVGQNLDTLYYIDTFSPNTYRLLHKRYFGILTSVHLRFMNTETYIKLQNIFLKLLSKNLNSFYNKRYLNIWCSIDEHTHSFSKLNLKFVKRKKSFKNEILPFLSKKNDSVSVLQNFKTIKFLRFVINTNTLYEAYQEHYNCNIITPYSESLMHSYFFNRNIKFYEIFYIKYLQDLIFIKFKKINFHYFQIVLKIKSKILTIFNKRILPKKKISRMDNNLKLIKEIAKKQNIKLPKKMHQKVFDNEDLYLKYINFSQYIK